MTVPAGPDSGPELTARRRTALLIVIALALMMVVSAVSGLNVALPNLAVDTGASQTQLTWIVDAYTVVFVGLLLPAGAFGDRFGRKGILLAGIVLFGAAAGTAMTTSSPEVLICLRALMGAGAAAVMPVTLSIITTSFPPAERGRAVGIWVGVAGSGAVIGLFGSGALLEFFSWNSFFGLNVALALLALAGAVRFVPGSRDADAPPIDVVGALLGLFAVVGVIFGIIEGPERGWTDPLTVTAFVVGAAGLVCFIVREAHVDDPLLDVKLFRRAGFSTGTITVTVQFFGSFGMFYIVLQYLQYIGGLSPLVAALALAPLPAVLIPLARIAPRLAGRFGPNRVMGLGLALSGSGLLLLTSVAVDFVYWQLAVGLAVFAAGMGLAGTPGTTAITESLPASKQGVGSAVNDTSRELGSALGIAILGTVLNSGYRSGLHNSVTGLPPAVVDHARSSIAFLRQGAAQLAQLGPAGDRLVSAARNSFVDAAQTSFLVAGITLLAAAVVIVLKAPRRRTERPLINDAQSGSGAVPAALRPAPRPSR